MRAVPEAIAKTVAWANATSQVVVVARTTLVARATATRAAAWEAEWEVTTRVPALADGACPRRALAQSCQGRIESVRRCQSCRSVPRDMEYTAAS